MRVSLHDVRALVESARDELEAGEVSYGTLPALCGAVEVVLEELERYRRSLLAHHNVANLSHDVVAKEMGGECPVCREAHLPHEDRGER